jgi:hypothetical protein
MDAMTRSRLLSLARVQPCAERGVTGVTGVTGPAGAVGSSVSHLPSHLGRSEKAQSDQGVTPVTPRNTPKWTSEREQGPGRCDNPQPEGVTARVTPFWVAGDAEDWQAAYDERAAVREFDDGLPRAEAERLAYADTVADLGQPPPGVQLSPPSATVIVFDPSRRYGE